MFSFFGLVTRRLDNFSVAKVEPDIIESGALINGRRVKGDVALHGIFHRTTEDLAIGNVAVAAANDGGDSLDAETQIRSRPFDLHPIGFFHQRFERFHPGLQFSVIEGADLEIEILKRFRAHAGQLRHRRRGPAQHDPLRFLHALVLHRAHFFRDQLHLFDRDVGQFADIVAPADRDIGIHLFHPRELVHRRQVRAAARSHSSASSRLTRAALDLRERNRARFPRGADERDRHFIRRIEGFDQDCSHCVSAGGIIDQKGGEFIEPGVLHRPLSIPSAIPGCKRRAR